MKQNSRWPPADGFKAVVAAGYKASQPGRLSPKLKALAWELGCDYFLACAEGRNCVCRPLGGGWSVLVFPLRADWFDLEVRRDFGRKTAARLRGVKEEYLREYLDRLIRETFPGQSS